MFGCQINLLETVLEDRLAVMAVWLNASQEVKLPLETASLHKPFAQTLLITGYLDSSK